MSGMQVWDHLDSKISAIRLASDAAITILKVDQVSFIFIKKNRLLSPSLLEVQRFHHNLVGIMMMIIANDSS